MCDYEVLTDEEQDKVLRDFPRINAKRLTKEVNGLFRAYLFVRRRRNEIEAWTSCCGRHEVMDRIPRTITPEMWPLLSGTHNVAATCPYCGAVVTVKNASRLGTKKNLCEYHPVVFLNAKRGKLYARCYWARKDYQGELNAAPQFMHVSADRFSLGKTEHFFENAWKSGKMDRVTVEGNYDPNHRKITEPFFDGGWMYGPRYVPYTIYGLDEIAKSELRWCQYDRFRELQGEGDRLYGCEQLHGDFIKYMTAYTIYPKQIEMLMKTFGAELVHDLVVGRRKNRDIINWNETDPRKAFRLTAEEMRAWKDSGCDIKRIGDYRRLRRRQDSVSFDTLREVEESFTEQGLADFLKWCGEQGESVKDVMRYLNRFVGPMCGMGYRSASAVLVTLKDYLAMAETLGYDLTVETVRRPRNLDLAHNEAATEINLRRQREAAEADKKQAKETRESLRKRRKKYDVKAGGYIIRIARTAEEVREEGRKLEHCVGGYAERHMKGTTTILFLREEGRPSESLYTIEMAGNRLVQIHGYRNEGFYSGKRIAPDPRKTMAWLLDPWLEWLEKGSPRNKAGKPVGLAVKQNSIGAA